MSVLSFLSYGSQRPRGDAELLLSDEQLQAS